MLDDRHRSRRRRAGSSRGVRPRTGRGRGGMSAGSQPLLTLGDVKVTFHTRRGLVRAVDGVSLEIQPGEVLALVGESGCGKTTLIRSILGLEPRAGGDITFDGRSVAGGQRGLRALRRRVQMVFQDPTGAL